MNLDSINYAMFEGMDAYCTLSVERMDEIGIGEILQKQFWDPQAEKHMVGNLSALDENWITKQHLHIWMNIYSKHLLSTSRSGF
jgi:hypothetical protein